MTLTLTLILKYNIKPKFINKIKQILTTDAEVNFRMIPSNHKIIKPKKLNKINKTYTYMKPT